MYVSYVHLHDTQISHHIAGLTFIALSPSGIVSVCPGRQIVLTCETNSSSFLYWTVSVPHLATTPELIVANQGAIASSTFTISFARFSIMRTSESPLISQLLIDNVTAGINESNIYCSEDGNENDAPMVTINVIGSFASKCAQWPVYSSFATFSKHNIIITQNSLILSMWM